VIKRTSWSEQHNRKESQKIRELGIASVVIIELFDLAIKREPDMLRNAVFEKFSFDKEKRSVVLDHLFKMGSPERSTGPQKIKSF